MARELTKKEKGFVKDYVETGNGVQSALKNYDTDDYKTASNIASINLDKPIIQQAILSIANQIPDSLLVEKHLALLNVPKKVRTIARGEVIQEEEELDSSAISKGLDMAYKLKGSYAAEKSLNVNINAEKVIVNDDQYQQLIRAANSRSNNTQSS